MRIHRKQLFKETRTLCKKMLKSLISPKYSDFEIEARSYIQAYIIVEMGMNFHQDIEQAFVDGAKFANRRKRSNDPQRK